METTYVHALTEYEIEACNRDAAKLAQGCNDYECSHTEYEVNPYDQQSETYSHIFTAATAMAAKIEHTDALDAKIKRRAELDAEITELMIEIAAAKTKRNNKLAAMDAEIAALEEEIAAHRRH
jgi:septal ring factor EnvC (AmiA/AmiB activator)